VATTTPPAPYQPTDDNDARQAVFQILGSDIDHAFTGDWHHTLQQTAAAWTPTRRQRIARRIRRTLHLPA
jgi:hypothetical protein